ncbi:MAG: potassium-transporting ATPase subunit F [Halanaerobiaceae bacterium]
MDIGNLILMVTTVFVFIYLIYVLFNPTRF